jgi:WD40 repeat protein
LALGLPLLLASLAQGAATAVPASLVAPTARAALRFLAGGVVEGEIGRAAALAEGWERAMLTLKLKVGAALVLVVGILGAAAGLACHQAWVPDPSEARQKDDPAAPPDPQPKPPAENPGQARPELADGRGDFLPEGAILRFGSARFRHGARISASALSPDGKSLATAGPQSVVVWDLDTGNALHRFRCDHGSSFSGPCLTFSPDGTRLGYVRGLFFACVWDLQTGKEMRRFERRFEEGHGKLWTSCCQFVNQGKELVLCSHDAIETWNVESGELLSTIAAKVALLSLDGRTYLRTEEGKRLILGDVFSGKEVTRLEAAARKDGIENGLAFSPDGKSLAIVHDPLSPQFRGPGGGQVPRTARAAAGNGLEIQLRATVGGQVLASFPLPDSAQKQIRTGEKYWEYRVTFSTDGKTLLLGTAGGLIHRWDLAAGKELPPLSKHLGAVAGMHTLPDGRTLVSTGDDGVIRRWDMKTGRQDGEPESYEGRSCAAYSLDGQFAAIGDARGRIDLWDGRTGKRVRTFQQEGTAVRHLAFSPDSKLLAAAEQSGTVRFWQVPGGQAREVWQRESLPDVWFCNGLAFSPDSRSLCISDYPKQIRVVEVASGKLLWTGRSSYAEAFSPDGATLLVAAPTGSYLTLLDAATGEKRATVRLNTNIPDGLGVMYTLAFSPDGRRLAVAQGDSGTLMFCDGQTCLETKRLVEGDPRPEIRELTGGKLVNQVRALAFSPDGKWFASAGKDTAVYLWETATGQEVLRLPGHEAEVTRVAFCPDGKTVFSHGQDGQGYLWSLKPKPAAGPSAALNELWTDLAEANAGKAYRAVWALSEDAAAVDFLRNKLAPASAPDKDRLAKLIAELDSDRFEVRDAANRTLSEMAEVAAPALEEACKTASSSEQRKRLEGLLVSLKGGPSPSQIRQMRAVQALELAGRADARQTLQEWAGGAPAALLTQEAQAALARSAKQK